MLAAYPELVGSMAKRGITRVSIAEVLGISSRTLYDKIMGRTEFTLTEANEIHSKFFPDMDKDTLFAKAEQEVR